MAKSNILQYLKYKVCYLKVKKNFKKKERGKGHRVRAEKKHESTTQELKKKFFRFSMAFTVYLLFLETLALSVKMSYEPSSITHNALLSLFCCPC